jgi:hypothetical protein
MGAKLVKRQTLVPRLTHRQFDKYTHIHAHKLRLHGLVGVATTIATVNCSSDNYLKDVLSLVYGTE